MKCCRFTGCGGTHFALTGSDSGESDVHMYEAAFNVIPLSCVYRAREA